MARRTNLAARHVPSGVIEFTDLAILITSSQPRAKPILIPKASCSGQGLQRQSHKDLTRWVSHLYGVLHPSSREPGLADSK
jgi:hypothetical protein